MLREIRRECNQGLNHGWSQSKHDAALSASGADHGSSASSVVKHALVLGQNKGENKEAAGGVGDARVPGIALPGHSEAGLGLSAAATEEEALGGLHWSTWYDNT